MKETGSKVLRRETSQPHPPLPQFRDVSCGEPGLFLPKTQAFFLYYDITCYITKREKTYTFNPSDMKLGENVQLSKTDRQSVTGENAIYLLRFGENYDCNDTGAS